MTPTGAVKWPPQGAAGNRQRFVILCICEDNIFYIKQRFFAGYCHEDSSNPVLIARFFGDVSTPPWRWKNLTNMVQCALRPLDSVKCLCLCSRWMLLSKAIHDKLYRNRTHNLCKATVYQFKMWKKNLSAYQSESPNVRNKAWCLFWTTDTYRMEKKKT